MLASGRPFLAVCLGHQVLADVLGFDLTYKDIVFQGTQAPVTLTLSGRPHTERVGFYNTFVARQPAGRDRQLPPGTATGPRAVRVDAAPSTGDINAIWGSNFAGIQFHAESILSEHGYDILHDLVDYLLSA